LLNNRPDGCWAYEHAKPWFAFEVTFALNRAIVFASGVCQFHTNPISNREACGADETDGTLAPVGQDDDGAG
jgi:hypothetical protein